MQVCTGCIGGGGGGFGNGGGGSSEIHVNSYEVPTNFVRIRLNSCSQPPYRNARFCPFWFWAPFGCGGSV